MPFITKELITQSKMKLEINGNIDSATKNKIKPLILECLSVLKVKTNDLYLEVIFLSPDKIQQINNQFRNIDRPTDVLSFPQAQFPVNINSIGTVFICPEVAKEEDIEITELVKHGLLHLLGYDHESDPEQWLPKAKIINHVME